MAGRRRGRRPFIAGTNVKPVKVEIDGVTFDSKTEARYYTKVLRPKVLAGLVREITVHRKFPININGKRIGSGWYTLDFDFEELIDGMWQRRYVEVKGGWDDQAGNLRRQLAAALHSITIEVWKG